jgi:transposase-like protein
MYRTASQRQETLAEYQASGESVSQWCDHSEIHRTTLYRWLRLETKQKAEKAKAAKRESEVRVAEAAQVKWLPITVSSGLEQTGIAESIMNPNKIEPGTYTTVEIRVQIGEFTVITPDGFKRETLETVCKALQAIC